MKNKKLFIFLPLIALTACNSLGKEITRDEASDKALKIYDKQAVTDVFSFNYTITTTAKTKEVRKYKYMINEDGSYMMSRDETEGNYRASKTIYHVKTTKSIRVLYVKTYDGASNKTTIQSYENTPSGQSAYTTALTKQEAFTKEIEDYFNSVVYAYSKDPGVGENYNQVIKTYSTGEGNMTAKLSFTYKGEENESAIKKIERTYKFNNNLFANYNGTYVTFNNKKRTEVASSSYKNPTVNLPADWDQYVITSIDA